MADTPATHVNMPRYPGQPPGSPPGGGPVPQRISEEPTGSIEVEESRFGKGVKRTGWIFLGVFCLIFFTITKLPQDRIKAYVQGNISEILSARGITMSTGSSKISFFLGVSYIMKDVTFNFPPPTEPAHIDSIEISPTLLPLLTGKVGAKVTIKNGDGDMTFTGGMRGGSVSGTLEAHQFDIGKIGLLKIAADIAGSAVISGKADFSMSMDDLTSTDASIDLDLRKIVIDSQAIQGFTIPKLAMSDGKIELDIDHGKGQIKTLRIGRPDSATDDIKAAVAGDLMFGKTMQNSTMNVKVVFSLSQNLMKAFALLDAILAPGKLPNGEYAYKLQGPILSPNPIPAGGG